MQFLHYYSLDYVLQNIDIIEVAITTCRHFLHCKNVKLFKAHENLHVSSIVSTVKDYDEHPGDQFFNTTIDLLPYVQPKEEVNYPKDQDGYFTVANFSHETGIAEGLVNKALGPISTVRLKVHTKSEAWVILNEVKYRILFLVFYSA